MRLAIFSDLHFRRLGETEYYPGLERKLVKHAEPLIANLIKDINEYAPDVVVNLGDIIEHVDRATDIKNLKTMAGVLKQINAPLYSVVGNHEIINLGVAEVAKLLGVPLEHRRGATFSVDVGGYHLVFLSPCDTEQLMPAGYKMKRVISDADLAWLEGDLARNKLPTIVFTHFGLAKDDMRGNHWFGDEPHRAEAFLENGEKVKGILRGAGNLLAVFSGHHHWTKTIVEDGIAYHVVGSLIEDTDGSGVPDGVWLKVEVDGGEVSVQEQRVGF